MLALTLLLGLVAAAVLWWSVAQRRKNRSRGAQRPVAAPARRSPATPSAASGVRARRPTAPATRTPASGRPAQRPEPGKPERAAAVIEGAEAVGPAAPPPGRSAPRPPDPARARTTAGGVAGQISLMSPIDFSKLVPAPGDLPDPQDLPISQYAIDEALKQAEQVSVHLRARQAILRGLSDASMGPREITDMVVSDAALAAQVLRTVNSPYYGLRHQQASVFRAVLFLGNIEVRSIVMRACLSETLGSNDSATAGLLEELWQHSFTVSRAAYVIAKILELPHPDEVATAALLHDVGKLISVKTWPAQALAIYQPLRISDHRVLAELEPDLGVGHARLGQEIAAMWDLPPVTSSTIGQHHAPLYRRPEQVEGNRAAIAVVHLADLMAHLTQYHLKGQEPPAAWLPREGWQETLKLSGGLQALCTPRVVLALLPPSLVRGEVSEEESAAA